MVARVTSWLWRPGLLRTLFSQARLAIRLLREPRVPLSAKAVPLFATVYLVSPVDLVPDVFPLIGQIDDLTLILVALSAFLKLCPVGPVAFHRAAIAEGRPYAPMSPADDVIEAEWRRN
jgi:uncharacterized membrane protein YkvA (DUF1232 family)